MTALGSRERSPFDLGLNILLLAGVWVGVSLLFVDEFARLYEFLAVLAVASFACISADALLPPRPAAVIQTIVVGVGTCLLFACLGAYEHDLAVLFFGIAAVLAMLSSEKWLRGSVGCVLALGALLVAFATSPQTRFEMSWLAGATSWMWDHDWLTSLLPPPVSAKSTAFVFAIGCATPIVLRALASEHLRLSDLSRGATLADILKSRVASAVISTQGKVLECTPAFTSITGLNSGASVADWLGRLRSSVSLISDLLDSDELTSKGLGSGGVPEALVKTDRSYWVKASLVPLEHTRMLLNLEPHSPQDIWASLAEHDETPLVLCKPTGEVIAANVAARQEVGEIRIGVPLEPKTAERFSFHSVRLSDELAVDCLRWKP